MKFPLAFLFIALFCRFPLVAQALNSWDEAETRVELTALFCGSPDALQSETETRQIREWEAINPQYTVEVLHIGWGHCRERLNRMAGLGAPPDMAYVGARELRRLEYFNQLNPIPVDDIDGYVPVVRDYLELPDNQLRALPRALSSKALFWSKDIFKLAGLDPNRPPETLHELRDFAKRIKEATERDGYCIAAGENDDTSHQFYSIFLSFGGQFALDFGEEKNNRRALDQSLEFYEALLPYANSEPQNTSRNDCLDKFVSGELAMTIQGPWGIDFAENAQMNYGVAQIPGNGTGDGHSVVIFDAIINLAPPEKVAATNDLIAFIGNPENQRAYERAAGVLPIRTPSEAGFNTNQLVFTRALENGYLEPMGLDNARTQETIKDIVRHYIRGYRNPRKLLRRLGHSLRYD